ncbi:MAG TPA: FG-GAP-like repeat-containing protein [Bacteroidota bacterium]|nr:FG-GAP-like repeat-containing protein [Bacteroidota bacterium]
MKTFLRLFAAGVAILLLGFGVMNAQEVTFVPAPAAPAPTVNAANGGFAWGDVNGDGYLDVFTPSTSITINNGGTTFTAAASTMTANLPLNTNDCGGLLADFNGDGVLDLFTSNGGVPSSGLYYNNAGVFTLATGTGDLATAGGFSQVFEGVAAAPIDHSNYLSVAWPGNFVPLGATGVGSNNQVPAPAGGIWMLKGGASGFTNIGKGATVANAGIDTSRSFEAWDVRFFDANNDGYMDLFMPSIRQGISKVDTGTFNTARKGCVLFLNDGTGKFIVPTSTTLARPIYALDSITVNKAGTMDSLEYASARADTGIIVDDTVRHFAAIGNQWGDLNNDGIEDLVLDGLNANDNRDGNDSLQADVILYGKGDGTFTYKWDGVHVVSWPGLVQNTAQRAISVGDYNNDGLADIFTCATFGPQYLYRNNGNGTFTNVAGTDALGTGGARAGQFVDYNNDGFLDIFMFIGGTITLEKNNGNTNHWIGFIPLGTGHNMSAIGARFTVYTGATKQIRDIKAEGGDGGMGGSLRANFGLGANTKIDSFNVKWPDGTSQTYVTGAANNTLALGKYYTIQEGSVIPAAPARVRPSWVAGDSALTSSDTLNWTAGATGTGTTTYTVQIATNSTFGNIVKTVSGVSSTNTIVRLGLSTKYYWRVQEFDNQLPSPFSAIDSFRTKVVPDTVTPNTLLPAVNSKTVASKNAVLTVSYVSTASTYHFQVRSDSATGLNKSNISGTGVVVNDSTSDFDTTYTITSALTAGHTYYWRVRGYNPAGSSAFSAVDSFTVMYIPAVPVLAYPIHNAPNVPVNTTFKWNRVAGDSNYVLQYWTASSSGLLTTTDTTKHDSSVAVTGLEARSKYYWKVMAYNQGGAGTFTAIDSFTTATEVPIAPTPSSPKNALGVNRVVKYVWGSVPNATSYHLQVSSGSTFPDTVLDMKLVDTSVVAPDTLKGTTRYYWHVSAVNAGGEGAFSAATTFQTGSLVDVAAYGTLLPTEFALMQNYPNPFNPATTISYDIPKNAFVNVTIYDVLGRVVTTLVDGPQAPNHYKVQWNASNISSGMYFLRVTARSVDGSGTFSAVKKMLFMK